MNDDIQQDAQVDSSATEQETQHTPENQGDSSSQSNVVQVPSSQQQDANQGAEAGSTLPPKDNLVGEIRRKLLDEMGPMIQATVRESMLGLQNYGNQQQAQPVKPQEEFKYKNYSKQQLEQILMHPDATEQDKMFANRGLGVIESQEEALSKFDSRLEKQQSQGRQTQALQAIISDYPQVFNKQTGQWNFTDPLFQRTMQSYNTDQRLQAFGNEGLRVAMDRAYSQMAREGQLTLKKKENKLTAQQRQVDRNQSQAMNAGTLNPAKQNGQETTKAKTMEAWKKNPDNADLRTAALKHLIPQSWLT